MPVAERPLDAMADSLGARSPAELRPQAASPPPPLPRGDVVRASPPSRRTGLRAVIVAASLVGAIVLLGLLFWRYVAPEEKGSHEKLAAAAFAAYERGDYETAKARAE